MYHQKNKKHSRKEKSQRIHFKRRLAERYGLYIDRSGMEEIGALIRGGNTIRSRKQTNRISIHILEYQGKELRIAYDKTRRQVVSALPNWNNGKSTKGDLC